LEQRGDATYCPGEGAINDGHQRQTCTCGDSTEPTNSEKADVKIRCIAKKSFIIDDCRCAIDLTGEDSRCVVGQMSVGLVVGGSFNIVTCGYHDWSTQWFYERVVIGVLWRLTLSQSTRILLVVRKEDLEMSIVLLRC
jgi:hypothetical protein